MVVSTMGRRFNDAAAVFHLFTVTPSRYLRCKVEKIETAFDRRLGCKCFLKVTMLLTATLCGCNSTETEDGPGHHAKPTAGTFG